MTGRFAALISTFSALGAFLFGLDIGYIAVILECATFKRDVAHLTNWDDPDSQISGLVSGFIVASFSVGAIAASFPVFSGYFLDSIGRKASIGLGTTIFLVGALLQASAFSITQMLAGRLIAGVSIGLLSTVVALYQSELAPAHMRGSLTSIYQLMITFGIFVATFLNWLLVEAENGWRLAILFQVGPASALLLGMLCLPRSPRWLTQQGRLDEALDVLKSMRDSEEVAAEELQEIVNSVEASKMFGEPLWSELFEGRIGKLILLGVTLQVLSQLCGMNAFMYFGPRIFDAAGLDPIVLQTVIAAVNFLATFPAIALADRCGRTVLLTCGSIGMTISCFMMGIVGSFAFSRSPTGEFTSDTIWGSRLIMGSAVIFVVSFAYSWGPMTWVYCSEIFPLKHRSRCVGLTTTSNWSGNYLIAQFTPVLLDSAGFSTFNVFGVFSFMGLLLALWIPETKGVLLEHIDRIFDEKFGVESTVKSISSESGIRKRNPTDTSSAYGATASTS